MTRFAILLAVLIVGCDPSSRWKKSIYVNHLGGWWDNEPDTVVLSCSPGFALASEMGRHSAKVWCEPADGGAR